VQYIIAEDINVVGSSLGLFSMATRINQIVSVGAIFETGKIKPAWMKWNGRAFKIEQVPYRWLTNEGAAEVINFSVVSGANLFHLTYNLKDQQWTLMEVEEYL